MEIAVEKLKGLRNKNEQDALFYSQLISIVNLNMFQAGLQLNHLEVLFCIYSIWYVSCAYVGWLLAGYTEKYLLMMNSKPAWNMSVQMFS